MKEAKVHVGAADVGAAEAHTTTFVWCLIASVRARLKERSRSFEAKLRRLFWRKVRMFGTAIIARTPATATVTMSSVSVKPRCALMLAEAALDRSVTNMFSSDIMLVQSTGLASCNPEDQFTLEGPVRRAASTGSWAVIGRDCKRAHPALCRLGSVTRVAARD